MDLLVEIAYLPSTNDDQEWQGVLHLSRVLPTLAAQLLTVFRSRGVVDHTHIAMSAEAALGTDEEPTDLALRLDYQLAHIWWMSFRIPLKVNTACLKNFAGVGLSTTT